jgi:RNA polymerase sigma factor (sigma-70 family)
MTDAELLEAYAMRRSDSAFSELVSRYINLVYSVALRQVRDAQLAEDVAQAVFLVLARKAGSIGSNVVMAGWFFRTTRFVAARAVRAEIRRQRHEVEAANMNRPITSSDPESSEWNEIAPHLDEAIATLGETDRNAVLLRFFEAQPMRVVGEKLSLSEDAAKKRVSRALEKLKGILVRRGIVLSGAVLAAGLSRNGAQAAPAHLAAKILTAKAGVIGSATTSALVTAAMRQLFWLKARLPLGFGAALVAVALLVKGFHAPPAKSNTLAASNVAGNQAEATANPPAFAVAKDSTTASAVAPKANVFTLHIRDASDNAPVSGARVIQDSWHEGRVVGNGTFDSDRNGICELPIPNSDFETFRVWVSAENFVPKVMDWHSYELKGSPTYTTKLDRGLTLEGVVEDEQGQPRSGASIAFLGPGISSSQRENVAFHGWLSTIKTDASGKFVSHQMPSWVNLGMGLAITCADFAPQWLPIAIPESLSTNWIIVLGRGVSLSGQVLTTNDDPVAGANVVAEESHGGADVKATADAQGNFKLEHVPSGSVPFSVSACGYNELKQTVLVETNSAPITFRLRPAGPLGEPLSRQPIRLSGKVVDTEFGEPVPQFTVLLNERRGTSRTLLGEAHDGTFDWRNPLTFVSDYTLEINADGYEPVASTTRRRAEGDQTFEFRLNKGGRFAGQVLQPDGQPAVGASIGLQDEGSSLRFMPPAKLVNYGHPANQTVTDAQGLFSLNSTVGGYTLLIIHDSGCAALSVAAKTNLLVRLEAWGAIEGMVYIGQQPAAGQIVDVGFESASYLPDVPRVPFDLMEKSDERGHFRFDRIPPGGHTVYRYINSHADKPGPIGFSHGEPVTVKPGETATVTLGGKGRTVIGRFALPASMTNYDWAARLVSLVENKTGMVEPREPQFPNGHAFFPAWSAYDASIAKYYLDFQPDGSFRVSDVLPGQYTLAVTINAPPADPLREDAWMYPGPILGGVTNTIVVPSPSDQNSEDSLLDVGVIPISITSPAPRTAQAP